MASSEDYGRDEQSAMVGTNNFFHFSKCCCAVLATRLFFYHFFFIQDARLYIVDTRIKWLVEMLSYVEVKLPVYNIKRDA